MKRIFFALLITLSFSALAQQNFKFGASIGYSHMFSSLEINNTTTEAEDGSGYLALFSEISLSNNLKLVPQLQYFTEFESFSLPIQLEFKTSIVNILAGVQANISTEDLPDDFTNFTLSAIGGLSYDIDSNLKVLANYSYGLTDSYTGDLQGFSIQNNAISFGLLYNFVK